MSGIESILIVARLTLREAFRRRLLWALVGLTALIIVLTWWGFSRIAEVSPVTGPVEMLGVSQVLVMLAFMFSFVLAMTAVFAASPAIGPEIESGLLLAILARPIRRADVLLGRWLGLAVVLVAYAIVAGYSGGRRRGAGDRLPADRARDWRRSTWPARPWFCSLWRWCSARGSRRWQAERSRSWPMGWPGWPACWVAWARRSTATCSAAPASVARLILPSDVLWRGAAGALTPTEEVLRGGGVAQPGPLQVQPVLGHGTRARMAGLVPGLDRRARSRSGSFCSDDARSDCVRRPRVSG